jgi:LDH2 family malate/lactate/ureidoglycolate dehydrogenase
MASRGRPERTYGQWWEAPDEQIDVSINAVREIGLAGLQSAGASREDADFLLSSILDKALQGDPVRGLWLVPNLIKAAREGREDLAPEIQVLNETPSTALVDGGANANGGVVCRHAMALAMAKAQEAGSAWVSVKAWYWNFGPLLKMAADRGLIAIGLNSSIPTVAPWGGTTPILGNAPTGIGIPAGKYDPVIVDLSITSTSSTPMAFTALWGNTSIPADFIFDQSGLPSADPKDYMPEDWSGGETWYNPRGSLVPLGGALSGHKGYALLFAVNLLATALSDTDSPWQMVSGGRSVQFGCQLVVVDPSVFLPIERFTQRVDEFIEKTKSVPTKAGVDEVLYPGERSQQLQREGRASGTVRIPISHYNAFLELADELGISTAQLFPG